MMDEINSLLCSKPIPPRLPNDSCLGVEQLPYSNPCLDLPVIFCSLKCRLPTYGALSLCSLCPCLHVISNTWYKKPRDISNDRRDSYILIIGLVIQLGGKKTHTPQSKNSYKNSYKGMSFFATKLYIVSCMYHGG